MSLTAKQRYYNNLAKKGKITKSQAVSMGASLKSGSSSRSSGSSGSSKTSSYNPYAKYQSMDWGSAAEAAKRAGIDTSTGSKFDIAMNEKYNPENANLLRGLPANASHAYEQYQYTKDNQPWGSVEKSAPEGWQYDNSWDKSATSKPSQVSNPTAPASQRANALGAFMGSYKPQSAGDYSQSQIKNDTLRQILGNGYYSNGRMGNGAGLSDEQNLGLGGGSQSVLDSLKDLFGVPTAQAAENPMELETSSYNPSPSYNSSSSYNPLMGTSIGNMLGYTGYKGKTSNAWGQDAAPSFRDNPTVDTSGSEESYTPPSNIGTSGGFSLAGSAQATAVNPQQAYYEQSIKNAKKLLDEQLKALKKQYKESEKSGLDALNKQKVKDLNDLSGKFAFGLNQDPNSEQAIQYSQNLQNDYAGQIKEFLNKLASAKSQDISAAKQNYYTQANQAQEKLAELMYNLQIAAQKSSGSGYKLGNYGIIPNGNGGRKYVYVQGGQVTPVSEDDYMAGKYGVGIGNYGATQGIEDMTDEELQSIVGY